MAGRTQNRRELRRQFDAAEPLDPIEDESDEIAVEVEEDEPERRPKKKPPTKAKAKATKPVKPTARMRVVWNVVSDGFKVVGTYEFNQKEAAEARVAELTARGKGTHFIQKGKEAISDDTPGLGAQISRTPPLAPAPAKVAAPVVIEEEEDESIEDEDEGVDEDIEEEEE